MPTDLFGCKESPFADGYDPRFLYPTRSHREAVAHLRRALERRESLALLTGLPGVGKTLAVQTALAGAGPHVRVTIVATPGLTREEFLARVLDGFAPDAPPADGIEARLRAVAATGRAAVLVVEEAQDLDRALLDDLRLYSNLEAGGHALLWTVLAGRTALERTLAEPDCEALRRRITTGYRLEPLDQDETEAYLRHRVAAAGGDGTALFAPEACATIHQLTHGIPREIGQLASESLALANTAGEERITAGHVTFAVMMLGFRSAGTDAPAGPLPVGPPAATPPVAEPAVTAPVVHEPPAPAVHPEPEVTAVAPPEAPLAEAPAPQPPEVVAPPERPAVAEPATTEPIAEPAAEPAAVEPAAVVPPPAVEPEPVEVVAVAVEAPTAAPRRPRRHHAPPSVAAAPRGRRVPTTTLLAAAALLVVAIGGFALLRSIQRQVHPRPTATVAVVTPPAVPAETPPPAPKATPAPRRTVPARAVAASHATVTPTIAATPPAPTAPGRRYGVEVATFLSESRAQAECDRLAASLQRTCRVVPTEDEAFAVVVGPVSGAREATELSVDLARRGLVGEARVVRWAGEGGRR